MRAVTVVLFLSALYTLNSYFTNSTYDVSPGQYTKTFHHFVFQEKSTLDRSSRNSHKRENLESFVQGAVKHSNLNTESFVFTISENSWDVIKIIPVQDNVHVYLRDTTSDVCAHAQALKRLKDIRLYKYFVLINDGVYGPVFTGNASWNAPFIKILEQDRVALVGSTLSCQRAVHVQSYFLMTKFPHIRALISKYDKCCHLKRWSKVIQTCEIGLSQYFLKRGYAIGATSKNVTFHNGDEFFEKGRSCSNPTTEILDIFETVMVKYGGNVFRENLIPHKVVRDLELWNRN